MGLGTAEGNVARGTAIFQRADAASSEDWYCNVKRPAIFWRALMKWHTAAAAGAEQAGSGGNSRNHDLTGTDDSWSTQAAGRKPRLDESVDGGRVLLDMGRGWMCRTLVAVGGISGVQGAKPGAGFLNGASGAVVRSGSGSGGGRRLDVGGAEAVGLRMQRLSRRGPVRGGRVANERAGGLAGGLDLRASVETVAVGGGGTRGEAMGVRTGGGGVDWAWVALSQVRRRRRKEGHGCATAAQLAPRVYVVSFTGSGGWRLSRGEGEAVLGTRTWYLVPSGVGQRRNRKGIEVRRTEDLRKARPTLPCPPNSTSWLNTKMSYHHHHALPACPLPARLPTTIPTTVLPTQSSPSSPTSFSKSSRRPASTRSGLVWSSESTGTQPVVDD
ncbi:hypothetical protein EDC01DRAFT_636449 [Geopyxis carbonaria]|nr:hypothetical protein EDC01DRAFT_636449 [Geopyxis carbonaria]